MTRRPDQQTVLLVDDEPRSIKLMQIVLGHAGYHVLAALNAEAGLEILQRERPDLVMVDLLMPGTDGISFCRLARQRPGHDALKLVLFTAMADADTRQQALQAGADEVLVKPFERAELLDRLEQLLARQGRGDRDTRSPRTSTSGTRQRQDMDSSPQAKVLIVDDDARTLQLVARLLTDCDVSCVTAGSASEALEILAAAPDIAVVLSDIYMPATDGLEFLGTVRQRHADRPWLQLLLITGQASVATAVAAMRLEASDYLLKPVEPKALRESVQHALARARSIREVQRTQRDSPDDAVLRQLGETAQALVVELRRGSPAADDADSALRTLNLLQRMADARTSVFGNAVMPEPAWEMLAELMSARLSGRHLSVTSLALASKSPMTTALRRIEDLIQGGLATRLPDPEDRRRTYIELTPEGELRMQLFLEGFSRIARGSA